MSNTTKYQPAPQRDSFEEGSSYTQAPPSYQATTPDSPLGEPRTSDDNIPDDFKFGGSVAEATIDIRMQFVRKVYSILTVQLLATTILSSISFFSPSFKQWIQTNMWLAWLSLFGSIGFMLLTYWKRKSYPMNLAFLSVFTILMAYAVAVIVSTYETKIVLESVILTLGIFVALTLFACQTKYDFTSWEPYLFGALWVTILFGFMAMFFPGNSTLDLVYSVGIALIFSAYILVDTQLVMRHYHVEEEIAAAISLYMDIINLFLAILRILNSQSNN
ncbi:MAG: sphingosine N-acyltransferase lag1 [Chaenotheca gracillima]|nr:MAG: sphingosine N-acyltransferase lag1 [Chaenotheca gracillima]